MDISIAYSHNSSDCEVEWGDIESEIIHVLESILYHPVVLRGIVKPAYVDPKSVIKQTGCKTYHMQELIWQSTRKISRRKSSLSNPMPIFKISFMYFTSLFLSLTIFSILTNLVIRISLYILPTLATLTTLL